MFPTRADLAVAELWGIGEADPLILGAVLATLLVCSVIYIVTRKKRGNSGD